MKTNQTEMHLYTTIPITTFGDNWSVMLNSPDHWRIHFTFSWSRHIHCRCWHFFFCYIFCSLFCCFILPMTVTYMAKKPTK